MVVVMVDGPTNPLRVADQVVCPPRRDAGAVALTRVGTQGRAWERRRCRIGSHGPSAKYMPGLSSCQGG